ncbi:carbon-nitrogen hydrolase [Ventosimonas gracilis]|uniref:Carbon-nitrogen hydrolase n=1 Tax=Ventosimonas gracilis TaxID=1680762 RepID=A0A139SS94_9GAMM|nr:carbon-nitrogen hydrolase family protein [Ventosimonas gracilis]KXU37321.1 carbon-nitrogen hydrolase [Ventosimonas gracilis]
MKVELAQIAITDGDLQGSLARTLAVIETAAADTDLLVLPESCLGGFPGKANVARLAEPLNGPSLTAVCNAAKAKGISVALGFTEEDNGRFFNSSVLIEPEQGIVLHYRKTHLWPGEVGIVEAGNRLVTTLWKGIRVGFLICYDIEFPETARALGQLGAQMLLVTNGNFDPDGPIHRTCIMARAMENQAFALMVNRCGSNEELAFCGGSAAVSPFGKLLAEAGRNETRISLSLDLSQLAASREAYGYRRDQRIQLPGQVIEQGDYKALQIA